MNVKIIEPLGVDEALIHELMGQLKGCTYEYYAERSVDPAVLAKRAAGADAIVVANAPVTAEVLRAAPDLRLLSVAFTGLDHVDLGYCERHGIRVINCAGYSTEAVAEEAFGLMLSLYRHLPECDRRSRTGGDKGGLAFRELYGKTLGVIGNGAIAQRVMELGRAFGMGLLCFARTQRPLDGVTYVGLDELCVASDVLSVHVPSVPETFHMVGAEQIALMRPSAILINTARGAVVDNDALAAALEEGRIAGAGLDVLDTEPPFDPNLPILRVPNTVIAPHIGFATQEALDARARMAIDHVREFVG
ncbi:MAG: NAD(P)-dependent oxidoreductase [Coriobacteriales bacterium]|nr:NAD(P)-dependent oxidoreductase [Coriobacteriales bacterium]